MPAKQVLMYLWIRVCHLRPFSGYFQKVGIRPLIQTYLPKDRTIYIPPSEALSLAPIKHLHFVISSNFVLGRATSIKSN